MDQEFACIGDVDSADALGGLAHSALELLLGQVGLANEATGLTDVHAVGVADLEETLLQKPGSSVRDHAVTLHFSESKTSVSRSTLGGLSGENLDRASPSGVHLVVDHVLQSLIEGGAEEDHDLHLLAGEAVVHDLVAPVLVA